MSPTQNPIPNEEELTREIVRVLRMGATFQAALHVLHSKLELPAVLDEQERMHLAAAYEGTAATLRSRAAKQPEGSDERAENERRAARYEARARVKRSGEPMPRELRTPKERLEAVSLLRDALVELLELIADVDDADLEFFEAALVDERGRLPPKAGSAGEQFVFVRSVLGGVLGRLGALVDVAGGVYLLPFALPTAESPDGVVTSMIAGTPGPQPRVVVSRRPPVAATAPATPTTGTPADGSP
jgi:hypothetical protein